MSKNLRQCLKTMHLYCGSKCPKTKKSLLNDMSKNDIFFKAIYEIVNNISKNNIKLNSHQSKKLVKHVKIMKKILSKPKSKHTRRLLVKQSGGFLPILLPIVGGAIADLLVNVISKKSGISS
jgi:hypothetical protein